MEASRDSANRPPPTRNLPPLLTGSVGRPRSFVRNTGVPSWAQGSHVTKSNNSPGGWTPPGRSTCGDRGPWSQNTHVGMLGCPDCGPVGLGDQRAQEVWSTPTHTHTACWTGRESGRRGHGRDRTRLRASRMHAGAPGGCCPPGSWNQRSFNHRPTGLASNDCPHWLPLWPRPESERLLHAHPLRLSQSLPPTTQPAAHAWLLPSFSAPTTAEGPEQTSVSRWQWSAWPGLLLRSSKSDWWSRAKPRGKP